MDSIGLLTIYTLENVATAGNMPTEKLVELCDAYYSELTLGVTRAYAAMAANQKIDLLVRCYNTDIPYNGEYVIIGTTQFRIALKQKHGDDVDLTLERLEDYLDVYFESESTTESDSNITEQNSEDSNSSDGSNE